MYYYILLNISPIVLAAGLAFIIVAHWPTKNRVVQFFLIFGLVVGAASFFLHLSQTFYDLGFFFNLPSDYIAEEISLWFANSRIGSLDNIWWLFDVPLYFPISIIFWGTAGLVIDKLAGFLRRRKPTVNQPEPSEVRQRYTSFRKFGVLFLLATAVIFSALSYREYVLEQSYDKVLCGGWDLVNGEVVCDCEGRYEKDTCPKGAFCDSGDYYCYGACGPCSCLFQTEGITCDQLIKEKTEAAEETEGSDEAEQGKVIDTEPVYPLSFYPDYPLDSVPATPISPKFLVEHRSALDGKEIWIKGTVVSYVSEEESTIPCPQGEDCSLLARMPQVTFAESQNPDRDKNYDLIISLISVRKGEYFVGQKVVFNVRVYGGKNFVSLVKVV